MLRGLLFAAVLFAFTAPLASAHVDPPGCVGNVFIPRSIGGVESVKRNGDVLSLTTKVGNNASGACNVTGATVRLAVPNPDGSFGTPAIVASGVTLPAGAAVTQRGPALKRTVAFDTGVFRGFVQLNLTGTQHSQPDPDVESDLGTFGTPLVISRPHTTFTVTPFVSGPPFTIDFTYTIANDSPSDPAGEMSNPTPGVGDPKLTDSGCSPVIFMGGDTTPEMPPIITKGETWTYECSKPFVAGSVLDIITFTGGSTRDGRPWPGHTVRKAYCGRLPATILGNDKANTIVGTAGQDVIVARGGNDTIKGMGGNDVICAGDGADLVRGGGGNDTIRGERGDDRLFGELGSDTLIGGSGHNTLQQ